jgi:hypothetical protein
MWTSIAFIIVGTLLAILYARPWFAHPCYLVFLNGKLLRQHADYSWSNRFYPVRVLSGMQPGDALSIITATTGYRDEYIRNNEDDGWNLMPESDSYGL